MERGLKIVFYSLWGIFGVAVAYLIFHVDLDHFDSFNFLLQARRLTESDYGFVGFDYQRPRSLVILLTFFNLLSKPFGRLPSLQSYHLLMGGVCLLSVLVWVRLSTRLWNARVGYLTGILILLQPFLLHYSFYVMTDNLMGLLWGLFLLVFLRALSSLPAETDPKKTRRQAWLVGFVGAVAGLGKHHLVIALPLSLAITNLCYRLVGKRFQWPWGNPKRLWNWSWRAMLSYALTIDLLTRFFGSWGEGVWEHFRHIYVQSIRSEGEPTPANLYYGGFWELQGGIFVVALFISLGLVFWRLRREKSSLSQLIMLSVVGGSTLFLLALSQYIPHKEFRYLIPLLPGVYALAALGLEGLFRPTTKGMGVGLVVVWIIAAVFPVRSTVRHFERYLSDPIYRSDKDQGEPLFEFLSTPNGNKETCQRIQACYFAYLGELPWELPEDRYYRRYDLEPHYSFYVKRPVGMTRCRVKSGPLGAMREQLGPIDPRVCYVVAASGESWREDLIAMKVEGTNLSFEEAETLKKSLRLNYQEFLHCDSSRLMKNCFRARRFRAPPERVP